MFETCGDSLLRLHSAVVNIDYSTSFPLPEAIEDFHLKQSSIGNEIDEMENVEKKVIFQGSDLFQEIKWLVISLIIF